MSTLSNSDWKRLILIAKYRYRIRPEVIPRIVVLLGVIKRRRAIRDVLGLVVKMMWKMRFI